jgi:hypothetical protein
MTDTEFKDAEGNLTPNQKEIYNLVKKQREKKGQESQILSDRIIELINEQIKKLENSNSDNNLAEDLSDNLNDELLEQIKKEILLDPGSEYHKELKKRLRDEPYIEQLDNLDIQDKQKDGLQNLKMEYSDGITNLATKEQNNTLSAANRITDLKFDNALSLADQIKAISSDLIDQEKTLSNAVKQQTKAAINRKLNETLEKEREVSLLKKEWRDLGMEYNKTQDKIDKIQDAYKEKIYSPANLALMALLTVLTLGIGTALVATVRYLNKENQIKTFKKNQKRLLNRMESIGGTPQKIEDDKIHYSVGDCKGGAIGQYNEHLDDVAGRINENQNIVDNAKLSMVARPEDINFKLVDNKMAELTKDLGGKFKEHGVDIKNVQTGSTNLAKQVGNVANKSTSRRTAGK